jgi:hypothetical protein
MRIEWAHARAHTQALLTAPRHPPTPPLSPPQRLLPCHRKEGAADYVPWPTKRFHAQPRADPLTGKSRDFFVFDGAGAAAAAGAGSGAGTGSFVLMSRDLPDQRGGFRNAGAEAVRTKRRAKPLARSPRVLAGPPGSPSIVLARCPPPAPSPRLQAAVAAMKTIQLIARRVRDRDAATSAGAGAASGAPPAAAGE